MAELRAGLPRFPDGRTDYTHAVRCPVLTCYVMWNGTLLLLKRSNEVSTYKGMWHTVAGYLDDEQSVEEKAAREIQEELDIPASGIRRLTVAEPYEVTDKTINKTWIIFPVLAELAAEPNIRLDWEHTEYRWIGPAEFGRYHHIPGSQETLKRAMALAAWRE